MTIETIPAPASSGFLEHIVSAAIRFRWAVLAVVVLLCGIGVWAFQRLPIDATPDITNVQVQITAKRPASRRSKQSSV